MKVKCKKDIYFNGSKIRRFFKGNDYHILHDTKFEYQIKDEGGVCIVFTKATNHAYKFKFDEYFTTIPELRQLKLAKI